MDVPTNHWLVLSAFLGTSHCLQKENLRRNEVNWKLLSKLSNMVIKLIKKLLARTKNLWQTMQLETHEKNLVKWLPKSCYVAVLFNFCFPFFFKIYFVTVLARVNYNCQYSFYGIYNRRRQVNQNLRHCRLVSPAWTQYPRRCKINSRKMLSYFRGLSSQPNVSSW